MIGAIIQNKLNQQIAEFASSWVDIKTSYDYVYEAAKDFSKETKSCHNSQTITTIANTAAYTLNPDFLEVITTDDHNHGVVMYTNASGSVFWLDWESYSDCLQNQNPQGTPSSYAITDSPLITRITGTASLGSTAVGGESTLTSATTLTSVAVGDQVVNLTQTYYGVVIATGAAPTTAMFNLSNRGGAYANWTLADSFIISPSPRYQIVLDPPPNTTGETVTVTYLAKPLPVYSDFGQYPFATGYEDAIIKYAAWMYKYRDSKPQLADPLYMIYDRMLRKAKNVNRKAVGVVGYRVNWTK